MALNRSSACAQRGTVRYVTLREVADSFPAGCAAVGPSEQSRGHLGVAGAAVSDTLLVAEAAA